MASNRPKMTVQVDFVNDPTSLTETWTDITPYCRVKGLDALILAVSRGRDYELAKTNPGQFTLALDNTDGRFDPDNFLSPYVTGAGNPGSAPGLVASQRRIRVQATWLGITYGMFRGYVHEWPQEWTDAGFFGLSNITGFDAISPLSNVGLQPLTTIEVLKDTPTGFYRCNDDVGSVSAGNSSSTNQPLSQIVAGSTAQTTDNFAFGGPNGSGNLTADPTSSLTFSATWNGFANATGYALRTADKGVGPLLPAAGGWAVEFWLNTANSTHNANSTLFFQCDAAGNQQAEAYLYAVTGGYAVAVTVGDQTNTALVIGAKVVSDGKWHAIKVGFAADLKTPSLIVDGVAETAVTAAGTALAWRTPYMNEFGGDPRSTFKTGTAYLDGSLKNLAIYGAPVTTARALAHFQAGTAFAGESSGTRVGRLLDGAAWPAALRTMAAGDAAVGSQATEGEKSLAAIQRVIDTEQGNLFIDGNGNVVFQNRRARYNTTPAAAFGEQAGEFHYVEGIIVQKDPKDVYNDVTVSRDNGITVRAINSASQVRYFPRSLAVSTVGVDDASVVYTAEFLLDRYKDPLTRIPQLVLEPSANILLWPQVLGREIGDRITVSRRPGGARAISADFFIEKVSHAVSGGKWLTTWLLSPASIASYMQLNSATYGRIGGGSTLNASMTVGQTTLVTPDALFNASDVPYTVTVGTERMRVTAATTPGTAPQTLTVSRGQDGTTAAAHNAADAVTLADAKALAF